MAFLVVAGVTVPVAAEESAATEEVEFIGDRDRMFNGRYREVGDGYKRKWPLATPPLTPAEYAAVRAALLGAPPLACSGDLLGGAVNCHAELGAAAPLAGTLGQRTLRFTLHEV